MAKRRGTKPSPTLKQQNAIDGIIDILKGRSTKSVTQALLDAGYAPESARQWKNIMDGLRPHLQPTVDWMELHRQRIMDRMDKTVDLATYAELTRGLDIVTKNTQLLQGKPTQNLKLTDAERTRLDELIDD